MSDSSNPSPDHIVDGYEENDTEYQQQAYEEE